MSAPELDFEIAQTARRIAHVEARLARIAGDSAELSRRVVLESERATLIEKASGLAAEARRLTITAPHGGVVRDADLDLGPGQWIDATTAIARVVGTNRAEVQGYVHEDDIWRIEAGQSAWFVPEDPLLAGRRGKLAEVAQAGTQNLELQYLSSVYGGAIASDRNDKGELRPRSGRYLVRIELEGTPFQRAVPGVIHVSGRPESTMAALWRRILQVVVRESGL